jgi:histone H3/H4
MNTPSIPKKNMLSLIQKADKRLQKIDTSPFSSSAFTTLKSKIIQYITELINESVKVSQRHKADTVSTNHIEIAADYLLSNRSRRFYRHSGTIGGVFLGAVLSNILTMTLTNTYTRVGIVLSVLLPL